MRSDLEGFPVVERSAEGLGVRLSPDPIPDIPVDDDGYVEPGNGMSVFGDPKKMIPNRRPAFLGGKSLLPLFVMLEVYVPEGLRLTPPSASTHMMLEPGRRMPIDEYEALLGGTRTRWRRIIGP
jgi:hypothetical protein